MAMLGIVAKLRVPYAHTSLEIIKMRYGKYAHWLFIVLNLINNIFGCGSMILAGAQLINGMTGMHIVAACILIPAGGKFVDPSIVQELILAISSRHIHSCWRLESHVLNRLRAHFRGSRTVDLFLPRSFDKQAHRWRLRLVRQSHGGGRLYPGQLQRLSVDYEV